MGILDRKGEGYSEGNGEYYKPETNRQNLA